MWAVASFLAEYCPGRFRKVIYFQYLKPSALRTVQAPLDLLPSPFLPPSYLTRRTLMSNSMASTAHNSALLMLLVKICSRHTAIDMMKIT